MSRRLLTSKNRLRLRGRNQMVSSLGCQSCASQGNLISGTIDECRCGPLTAGGLCTQCNVTTDLSQQLRQGHVQGDPGWLPTGYSSCGTKQFQVNRIEGDCAANGACVNPVR